MAVPPRTRGSRVVNTAGVLSDRGSKALRRGNGQKGSGRGEEGKSSHFNKPSV